MYKQYVRPHLEFAAPAWAPWQEADKACLEDVQKRAVRMVSGLQGQTYEERISELGLLSLEERRHQTDMCRCTKSFIKGTESRQCSTWRPMARDPLGQQLTP